jgi:hypothetical protein
MIVGGAVDFGGTADGLTTGGDGLVTGGDDLATVGDGLVTGGDDLATGGDGLVIVGDGLVTGGDVFATGAVTSFLGSTGSTCQRWRLAMETKMKGSGINTVCISLVFPL